jgi:hypothetical protein
MCITPEDVEQHRRECEARWVLSLPTLQERREYLSRIEKRRGKDAADYLKTEVENQWRKRSMTSQ